MEKTPIPEGDLKALQDDLQTAILGIIEQGTHLVDGRNGDYQLAWAVADYSTSKSGTINVMYWSHRKDDPTHEVMHNVTLSIGTLVRSRNDGFDVERAEMGQCPYCEEDDDPDITCTDIALPQNGDWNYKCNKCGGEWNLYTKFTATPTKRPDQGTRGA